MANKCLFFILPLILALALAACAGPSAQPIPTITPRIYVPASPTDAHTPPPASTSPPTPTPAPSLTPTKVFDGNMEKGDYLIYLLEGNRNLFFYDPATDNNIPILPEWKIFEFTVSMKDQIAFSSYQDGNYDIYILDYPYWENTPVNITNTHDVDEHPKSWSTTGEYLLTSSVQENGEKVLIYEDTLSVWDGAQFFQIYTFSEKQGFLEYSIDWSKDGKLAFSTYSNENNSHMNINIWDGNPLHHVHQIYIANQIQNDSPAWNSKGQLAFLNTIEDNDTYAYRIFVWSGNTYSDGTPDLSNIIEVANNMELEYYSRPNWSNNDTLIFRLNEILYEWDGTDIILSPINDIQSRGTNGPVWGPDNYFATMNRYLEIQRVYIHNSQNETISDFAGMFPAWSPEGQIAACVDEQPPWVFSIAIWNGSDVINLAKHTNYIFAMWRNGEYIYCTNG